MATSRSGATASFGRSSTRARTRSPATIGTCGSRPTLRRRRRRSSPLCSSRSMTSASREAVSLSRTPSRSGSTSPSTSRRRGRRYQQLVRDYVDPSIGSLQAAKLDAELLEQLYSRLQKCRARCGGRPGAGHTCRPLSNSTVRQVHFIIRAALDRAVRWQYIAVNPAALALPPSFKKPTPDPPSAEEIAAVLNEAWKEPAWGLLLWLVMVTGCRRGELCALRWTDLNLDRATLKIERSSQQTTEGVREKGTKSGQERLVALDPYTVDLLRAHRAASQDQCEQVGTGLARAAFIFSASADFSTPLVPSSVSQRYRRLAVRNQLRSTRIHALRHYSATELLSAGVDVRTVAGRLGHGSGGATTLRYYAAWVAKADHRAAASIADTLPRPDTSRRHPRSPYEKLAAQLRGAIEQGIYPVGSFLPITIELASAHNVSVGTVNRAIALLKSVGLVAAKRGERATVLPGPGSTTQPQPSG